MRSNLFGMTTTEVFTSGEGQVVRIPHGFEFTSQHVAIRKEGEAVILEPIPLEAWPTDFFDRIRIDDMSFGRAEQGTAPPLPSFDAN